MYAFNENNVVGLIHTTPDIIDTLEAKYLLQTTVDTGLPVNITKQNKNHSFCGAFSPSIYDSK